jgi:HlyD family secretion protein
VYVDEADVGSVKVGQEASFTVSAYPGGATRPHHARGFGSTITDNVVTYLTWLDVDNSRPEPAPGHDGTATITATERNDVLLVPNSALRFTPAAAAPAARPRPRAAAAAWCPS